MADLVVCRAERCSFRIVTEDAARAIDGHTNTKHRGHAVPFHVEPHRPGMPAMTSAQAGTRGHVPHPEQMAADEAAARLENEAGQQEVSHPVPERGSTKVDARQPPRAGKAVGGGGGKG